MSDFGEAVVAVRCRLHLGRFVHLLSTPAKHLPGSLAWHKLATVQNTARTLGQSQSVSLTQFSIARPPRR